MKRTLMIVLLVAAAVGLFPFLQVSKGCGHFELRVEFENMPKTSNVEVKYEEFLDLKTAQSVQEIVLKSTVDLKRAVSVNENTWMLDISMFSESGPYGIEYSYGHFNYVVLVFRWQEDGTPREAQRIYPVPPGRGPRTLKAQWPVAAL